MKSCSFLSAMVVICSASIGLATPTVLTLASPSSGDALIIDSSGNLYNASSSTLFELPHNSTLTQLGSITALGSDARTGLAIDSAGNIYGTASGGGAASDGIVFEYVAATKQLTTLATFTGNNGASPSGNVVVDANGDVFGTTSYGGDLTQDNSMGAGTVFEVVAGTHTITTLNAFNENGIPASNGGFFPGGGLSVDSAGNLYGTTTAGGAFNDGTIFKVAANTHILSELAPVSGGVDFNGVTVDGNGDLYGMTAAGSAFELSVGTSTTTVIATSPHGGPDYAFSNVSVDGAGNVFVVGSAAGNGITNLFEIPDGSGKITTVTSLPGSIYESEPGYTLAIDTSDNLYAATGEILEITDSGFVPEPGGMSILACGGIFLFWRIRPRR